MINYTISDKDFKKFSELVYDKTGINLSEAKKQLLQSRVNKILRKKNIATYSEYYDLVSKDQEELIHFIDAISTNVTSFFREEKHFQFMADVWAREFLQDPKDVSIWSAACSSGEEPYSIAIQLFELFNKSKTELSILASDISTRIIAQAQKAVYSIDKLKNTDLEIVKRYFLKGKNKAEGYVRVKDDIKRIVQFNRINLIENYNMKKEFDIIFCRNVMIYFDNPTRQKIVNRLYHNLKNNGYLFIGHSESLNGIQHSFRFVSPAIYRKVI